MTERAILAKVTRRLALLTGALLALTVPGAGAQVFVDPESPSGKEYAIPLEAARRQADPERRLGDRVPSGARDSPLFGEGVGDDDGAAGTSRGGGGNDSRGEGGGSPGQDRETGGRQPALSKPAREALRAAVSQPGAPSGGGEPALMIGLGAAGVVGAAVALGVLLRRRSRPS